MEEESTEKAEITNARIVLLGDKEVGKTSVLLRFLEDIFPNEHIDTTGMHDDIFPSMDGMEKEKTVSLPNKAEVKLEIWDTPADLLYRNITAAHIRDSHAICIVYDVTKSSSFENLENHIHSGASNPPIIFIVGNKSDMDQKRQVTFEEGKTFADRSECEFKEVSAANGQGVNELFISVANAVYRRTYPD